MFPITAKGMIKFIYTISSSVGSNLIKLAVGSGLTEEEIIIKYFESKLVNSQAKLFMPSLSTINQS
jgi:hypothetical protein